MLNLLLIFGAIFKNLRRHDGERVYYKPKFAIVPRNILQTSLYSAVGVIIGSYKVENNIQEKEAVN